VRKKLKGEDESEKKTGLGLQLAVI
jgi:hypothetical protein